MKLNSQIIFISLLFFVCPAIGQSGATHYYNMGNQAYKSGDLQTALKWYHKVDSTGFQSSRVYYNTGNCYYKLGRTGKSILFYEKALKLNPNDHEILENLQIANLRVIDRVELPPRFILFEFWDKLIKLFTISELTVLLITFYIITVLLVGILLFIRYGKIRSIFLSLLIIFGVVTFFFTYLLVANIEGKVKLTEAIILVPAVNVQSAPDKNGTDVFLLHEGTKVTLDEQRGDWVKIRLPDGKTGWMRQIDLEII